MNPLRLCLARSDALGFSPKPLAGGLPSARFAITQNPTHGTNWLDGLSRENWSLRQRRRAFRLPSGRLNAPLKLFAQAQPEGPQAHRPQRPLRHRLGGPPRVPERINIRTSRLSLGWRPSVGKAWKLGKPLD